MRLLRLAPELDSLEPSSSTWQKVSMLIRVLLGPGMACVTAAYHNEVIGDSVLSRNRKIGRKSLTQIHCALSGKKIRRTYK